MTVLYTYPGTGKHLINGEGRLADCVCCCEGLPDVLFFHIEPNFDQVGCDQVPDKGLTAVQQHAPCLPYQPGAGVTSCPSTGWKEDPFNELILQCKSGTVEEPPVLFGLISRMYCLSTNNFFVDICWQTPAAPDDFDSCTPELKTYVPVFEHTCNAGPGEFLVDLGDIYPLEGHPTAQCDCTFHVWIDEQCGIASSNVTPVYFYPAEAAQGIPPLRSSMWAWELIPSITTPLYPNRLKPPKEIADLLRNL